MVSLASIIAMFITLVICMFVPIIALIVYAVKNKGKGVWIVEDDIVTITTETDVTKLAGVIGTYFVDLSTKDTLVLTRVVESLFLKNEFTLTRVKDAK